MNSVDTRNTHARKTAGRHTAFDVVAAGQSWSHSRDATYFTSLANHIDAITIGSLFGASLGKISRTRQNSSNRTMIHIK